MSTLTMFAAVLKTIGRELKRAGLPTSVSADDLNALNDALARIEDRARDTNLSRRAVEP